jgi:ABC-type transporter Mla maintaining outer membrane lipid asymmetry ATPase subunit MlaF
VDNSPPTLIQLVDANIARAEALTPHPIIRDVTWSIRQGDLWVVGGPPGTGKSDLLTTAAGLQKPLSGYHRLFGEDVFDMDEQELVTKRLRIGMVFGNGGRLFSQLTIAENLALPVCYHRDCTAEEAGAEVNKALAICELAHIATRRSGDVTRNLHQRIGLARALALEPEVLMIDNPLLSVDPRQARWWIDFLCLLHNGHPLVGHPLTIAVATDDFRPWTDVGHQFALIKDKTWQQIGTREALKGSNELLVKEMLASSFGD